MDDPLSLLYNMNDCYSKLKELVPSIPQNKNVSKMEILQHVIDYILDLQIALDSSVALTRTRTPLTTLNTDISILSLQVITTELGAVSFVFYFVRNCSNTALSCEHRARYECYECVNVRVFVCLQSPELPSELTTDDSRTLHR